MGTVIKVNQRSNLERTQKHALEQLAKIDDLIIRQADKGGAVVALDKGLYSRKRK